MTSVDVAHPLPAQNCAAVQALHDAKRVVENSRLQVAPPPNAVLSKVFATTQDAKAYLEAQLGRPIDDPRALCRAEAPLKIITSLKVPNGSQVLELQKAYKELQTLVDQDALRHCEQRILEGLGKLSDDIQERSLVSLDSLAPLISSLLNTSGMQYTFTQLDLLVTKINELSQAMVLKYQMTNQEKTLQHWIEIMLTSAEKNPDNKEILIKTFKTATKALQASSQNRFSPEQVVKLRTMARLFQKGPSSEADRAVAQEILDVTGSKIWLLAFVNSYLECLPEELKNIEDSFKRVGETIYSSKALTTVALAPLALFTLGFPDRVIKAGKIFGVAYCAYRAYKLVFG